MSMVIEFRPRNTGQSQASSPRGPAEIIIFDGVRIERLNERVEQQAKLRKRRAPTARRVANADPS